MFRLAPYRRPHRLDSMMPRVFGDWFNWPNWPEVSVQGFEVDVQESDQGYVLKPIYPVLPDITSPWMWTTVI